MKYLLLSQFLACSLLAVDSPTLTTQPSLPQTPGTINPALTIPNAPKSIYSLDPKNRSADLIQAYELLKKEKPTLKISLRTATTGILPNIVDISNSLKGTLLFVKIQSNLGPKTIIIPVEEVAELYYSS